MGSTHERLIEQDELRFRAGGARDLRATALTAAEHIAHVLAHVVPAELIQQRFELRALLRLCALRRFQYRADVVSTLSLRNTLASCGG